MDRFFTTIIACSVVGVITFLLGWLFPVEGPYDYVYDNYVEKKKKDILVPVKKEPKKEISIGEILDWYLQEALEIENEENKEDNNFTFTGN